MKRVYFIKPIGMAGPIKIGCSQQPAVRCRGLDTWSPFALEVVATIEGDHELERRFHAYFLAFHERREWFRASPEINAAIDSINAGTFNIDQLPAPLCVSTRENGVGRKRAPWFGRQMSYSLRVGALERKSGFTCPVRVYGMVEAGDEARIAAADAFLRDPVLHGDTSNEWAVDRRAAFIARKAA